jgi:hypothetical protein
MKPPAVLCVRAQMSLLLDIFDRAEEYRVREPVRVGGGALLILADDDRGFSGEEREALKRTYPEALVRTFSSGGHLSGITHEREFASIVDEFLQG